MSEPSAPEPSAWIVVDQEEAYCSCATAKNCPALVIVPDCGHFDRAPRMYTLDRARLVLAEELEREAMRIFDMDNPTPAAEFARAAAWLRREGE